MKYYAKTYYENGKKVGETVQEHTENLLAGIAQLQKFFSPEIGQLQGNIWQDLRIACLLHDLGKVSVPFQNKIRKALSEEPLPDSVAHNEVPHNYLSPAFLICLPELKEEKNRYRFYNLLYSIAFHHDRPLDFIESALIHAVEGISHPAMHLSDWLQSHIDTYTFHEPKAFYYSYLKAYRDGNRPEVSALRSEKSFILLKGLLHRLDHAASAHLPVETARLEEPLPNIQNYLKKRNFRIHPFQRDAVQFRAQCVILTASTGIGKTEFALNWLGDSKGFYTLPLRVSVNAMYKRLANIFPSKTGILHSDTYSLCQDDDELSMETSIQRADSARQFAYPLIVTTADQLFTSVFKWPGYEKIYATLMYSKVILDEPQSYSAKTLAMIIRALEELTDYGSSFCYMSATQHPFIVKRLSSIATKIGPFHHDAVKHKISLRDVRISSLKAEIVARYNSSQKVLVIANTVKMSQELFTALRDEIPNINLLHSGFIKMHRDIKEESIQDDDKKSSPVIWITTQIVEASLDIDYDVLFTEVATLDSLIQRMGRVFRKAGRSIGVHDDPNIIIACTDPSDQGHIYEREIVQLTKGALSVFDEKEISEAEKQNLINQVFDEQKLRGTRFLREFDTAYELLKLGFQAPNKSEAQSLFREINQVNAIPESIYALHEKEIDRLIQIIQSTKDKLERVKANTELSKFLVSIPAYKKRGKTPLFERKSQSVYIIPAKYCETLGLQYDKIENIY